MKRFFLLCAAPLLVTSGCVTTDAGDGASQSATPREYRTGSNIPTKDAGNTKVYDREALERAQRTTSRPPGVSP